MSNPRPITKSDVDRACGIASLLNVVALASRMIENVGEANQLPMTSSIAAALDLAAELTEELAVVLEKNVQKEFGDDA